MRVVLVEPQLNMEMPINLEVSMNRGYHMAARSYEISLRVLFVFFSTRKEKFRICKWPCTVLFII